MREEEFFFLRETSNAARAHRSARCARPGRRRERAIARAYPSSWRSTTWSKAPWKRSCRACACFPLPTHSCAWFPSARRAHARRACDLTLPSPRASTASLRTSGRSVKPRTGRSTSTAATRCSWRWRAAAPTRTRRKRQPFVNVLGERARVAPPRRRAVSLPRSSTSRRARLLRRPPARARRSGTTPRASPPSLRARAIARDARDGHFLFAAEQRRRRRRRAREAAEQLTRREARGHVPAPARDPAAPRLARSASPPPPPPVPPPSPARSPRRAAARARARATPAARRADSLRSAARRRAARASGFSRQSDSAAVPKALPRGSGATRRRTRRPRGPVPAR